MALTDMAARAVADKLPKVIDPKTHAFIDYAVAGTFFILGAVFWRRNKRAAIGAMLCGGATAETSMQTEGTLGIGGNEHSESGVMEHRLARGHLAGTVIYQQNGRHVLLRGSLIIFVPAVASQDLSLRAPPVFFVEAFLAAARLVQFI